MLLRTISLMPCSPSRPRHYGLITSLLFPVSPPRGCPALFVLDKRYLTSCITKSKGHGRSLQPQKAAQVSLFPPRAAIQTLILSALSPRFGPRNTPQCHQDDKKNDGLPHGNPSSSIPYSPCLLARHLANNLSTLYAKNVLRNGSGELVGIACFSW